ncbi:MAG TPA: GAF domain-containing protein [Mycobacterium sp.]|uniref:GAF domain-containing sensor histidine kinase n=1 Tax=Mycobacterium sp. TaxID=1785 RepID=UPI002F4194CC
MTEHGLAQANSGQPGRPGGRLARLLVRPTPPPLWQGFIAAAALIALETAVVLVLKHFAPTMAFGTVFLLGVLLVGMAWGFGLAAITALVSAVAFDTCRSWPDGFGVIQLQNWVVIVIFFAVALLANSLAGLARASAIEADRRRHEADLAARQQAALRRVATLVARNVPPSEVFSAVAAELATCLDVQNAALLRYEPDGTALLLAAADEPGLQEMPVGESFSLNGESVAATVWRTGRVARMDSHDYASGSAAARIRALGLTSGVGAPIMAGSQVWGAAIAGSSRSDAFPPNAEQRVSDFADLITIAIANANARAELRASRARIVGAADETRRRIERDLHDGAQQRLVSLGLKLRLTEESVSPEQATLRAQISDVVTGLVDVSDDLREIARGIHPAILSQGGLGPTLKTLARRCAVPVQLDVAVPRRLPDYVEVAGYYLVAEALTNVAKHAQASLVQLAVKAEDDQLYLSIRDDGIGGADTRKGSGLIGLVDRVEALGGQIAIASRLGEGTSLVANIPLGPNESPGGQSSELAPVET